MCFKLAAKRSRALCSGVAIVSMSSFPLLLVMNRDATAASRALAHPR
jgi:hypothetical protein